MRLCGNDVAADDAAFIIESMGLAWEEVPCGFAQITLYVADLESLLKLKLSALEDSALSGRTRDLDDTIRILLVMGYDKKRFKGELSYLRRELPHAYRMLKDAIW